MPVRYDPILGELRMTDATSGGTTTTVTSLWKHADAQEEPDGLRTMFSLPESIEPGSLAVFLNGQLISTDDYLENGSSGVTLTEIPQSGDILHFMYRVSI